MDLITVITWICTAASLWGTYLNVKQNRNGFLFWASANVFWVWYNWTNGTFALALQFAVYLVLAIMGYRSWKKTIDLEADNERLRAALDRMYWVTKDTCGSCGAGGQDCDGCVTDARLDFISSALARNN